MTTLRIIEFLALFVGAPTLFAYARHRFPAIPALWVLMGYCLFILLRDPQFDRGHLWDPTTVRTPYLLQILGLWLFAVIVGVVSIRRFAPDLLFSLPRANPRFWGLIMVLYPVFSVYPQGIIYRAFLFHRYRDFLVSGWLLVLASTFAFAYVHIIFRNPLAVVLTALGGVIFGFRYWQTGSLVTSSIEHALYGCGIFTIGFGRSFYHGAVRGSTVMQAASARAPGSYS